MMTNRLEETLTPAEAREVFGLAARLEGASSPRVEDVAETLGVGPDRVRDLLTEVRARTVAPPSARTSPLAYLGWGVAAVAVAWAVLKPGRVVVPASTPAAVPSPPILAFGEEPFRPLREVAVIPLAVDPPAGYTVGVRAHGVVLSAAGRSDVLPKAGVDLRSRLADSVALLAQRAETIGASHAFEPERLTAETALDPQMEVWVEGPGYRFAFHLPAEVHTGRPAIATLKARRELIRRSLDPLLSTGPRVGPETGVVGRYFPPSGFEVEFKGRRAAGMMPGPIAVEPFDAPAARERLFLAMRTMMDAASSPNPGRGARARRPRKG